MVSAITKPFHLFSISKKVPVYTVWKLLLFQNVPGVVESLKIMTEEKCSKIAKFAFDYARRNERKRVTSIHKANIM